ncbi:MAG TPA: PstS family phosphate ABC transporter substrate-binding protein [Candidatus Competibacteraceae bacterium]|nr:PstS family phosphate ABC transporter substrate-binding protein [Candidatus Competibacteraceae bacterium]HRZ06201.1 PstS family phosphate ABC transporter substrate-binding protein [Candidatus Competibacteraceae bacterium]
MLKQKLALAVAATLTLAGVAHAQSARDYISIVGSSTVYPFTTTVAEQFGKANASFKTPKVESTGTGGGFKLFCGGVGVQHPDVSNASRAIKKSEIESCAKNGVTDIVEINIGFDGIVVASSKKTKPMPLTIKDLWLALAKEVPEPGTGKLVANPFKTWQEVNPELPAKKIEVLGPPPTSGTRDAFVELVMDHGCKEFATIKELEKTDEKKAKAVCQTIREDGVFIEAGENDNLIVQKLVANPNALGIFGFSFLEENLDKIQGETINGVTPNFENIADGKYPVSRPLFIYVKKAHVGVIPGIKEFIAEFTSEKAVGDDGYLSKKGLIPLPDAKRKQVAADAKNLKTMTP